MRLKEEIREADDCRQHVVEVVGDKACELADGFHLLTLCVTGFERLLLGHVYLIDVTQQKALEARYAQSQKMEAVGKLAGFVAHDFNNMLTAIIGFSDFLLQTHRPGDPAHSDIINIKSSANRAAG